MSCAFEKELLSAYHDGELDAAGRGKVEGHVGSCSECARELEDVRSVSSTLGAPAGIAERVGRSVAPSPATPRIFRIRRYLEAGLAAAAGLLIVFTVVAVFRSGGRERTGPVAASGPVSKDAGPADKRSVDAVVARRVEREDLAKAERPQAQDGAGRGVPMPMPTPESTPGVMPRPIEAPPAPPAAEPGFAPPGEPAVPPEIEEPAPFRAAEVLVIGDDIRSADEAVNELLRKLSTDYRRRDSVWEATLTEADAAKLVQALQARSDVQVSAAPQAGEMLAKLADEAWHYRDSLGADKANRARAQGQEAQRPKASEEPAIAKGDREDQKSGAAKQAPAAPPPTGAPSRGGRGGGGAGAAPGGAEGFAQPEEARKKFAEGERKAPPPPAPAAAKPKADAEPDLDRAVEPRKVPLARAEKGQREEGGQRFVTLRIYIVAPEQSDKLGSQDK
jgi:hypothetical protein